MSAADRDRAVSARVVCKPISGGTHRDERARSTCQLLRAQRGRQAPQCDGVSVPEGGGVVKCARPMRRRSRATSSAFCARRVSACSRQQGGMRSPARCATGRAPRSREDSFIAQFTLSRLPEARGVSARLDTSARHCAAGNFARSLLRHRIWRRPGVVCRRRLSHAATASHSLHGGGRSLSAHQRGRVGGVRGRLLPPCDETSEGKRAVRGLSLSCRKHSHAAAQVWRGQRRSSGSRDGSGPDCTIVNSTALLLFL